MSGSPIAWYPQDGTKYLEVNDENPLPVQVGGAIVDTALSRVLVVPKYNYTYAAGAVTIANLKVGAGVVHTVNFTPVANGVITLYNTSAVATGDIIFQTAFPAALLSSGPVFVLLDAAFTDGLAWAADAATRTSVTWL